MMQFEVTVGKIIQQNILSCSPDTPLAEAARRMVEGRCSSILVEDGGKAVGIWTEQDALTLDIADPGVYVTPISQSMSRPVKTLPIDTTLGDAALQFREEGVRHFLVVDSSGEYKGIISQSDIVINQGIEYFVALREVKSVFNHRHLVVPGALPLPEAIREMKQGGFDALIVRHPECGYGILTERDVVRLIGSPERFGSVEELASYPLVTLPANSSLYQARKYFVEKHIRHLGITGEQDELLGLLTFADILSSIEHEYVHHLRDALKENKSRLEDSNHHLRLAAKAFESTFEGIMVTDANRVIESVNPAFTQITGYQAHEVIGKTPSILSSGKHDASFFQQIYHSLAETGHWQGEICNRRSTGELYVELLTISAVKDQADNLTNYVAVFTDFTTRKAAEEHMRFLAQHDILTSLPNRMLLTERLIRAIPHATRNGKKLAVIFVDLDEFKQVNDIHGHAAGDQILKTVAQRMTKCVRAEDTVARLGGDEFVLVVEEITNDEGISTIVDKIIDSLTHPILHEGREMKVSVSIGISIFPDDGNAPDALIENADKAMYLAKAKGRNTFQFFSGDRH
ncbi:MAG: diguanylate cyclase [Sterolibacterium sp.]